MFGGKRIFCCVLVLSFMLSTVPVGVLLGEEVGQVTKSVESTGVPIYIDLTGNDGSFIATDSIGDYQEVWDTTGSSYGDGATIGNSGGWDGDWTTPNYPPTVSFYISSFDCIIGFSGCLVFKSEQHS